MSETQSAIILQVFLPVFTVLFTLVAKFVLGRIPLERKFRWKIACAGGYIMIMGGALTIYFDLSRVGPGIANLGILIMGIALVMVQLPRMPDKSEKER